jgi:hypothetical protein
MIYFKLKLNREIAKFKLRKPKNTNIIRIELQTNKLSKTKTTHLQELIF